VIKPLRRSRGRQRANAAIAAVLLVVAGCTNQTSHAPPAGTATFRWSIREGFVPEDCDASGATTMEVLVYDSGGARLVEIDASCTSFSTTTVLQAGSYSATLQLVDARGRPVSTVLDTGTFDVVPDADVLLDTDFPADSLF
jgi:hypothetical protein